MKIGTVIHNFKVTRSRAIPEINAVMWYMIHRKTGTELVWIDRKDDNKAFSIAFKTIPDDSTGVFHILEHSVLGGSDKYPVKEPFVELLKSSVQTFLNAMTYPDKTVYPVSSRNDKDFLNLIDIYLDGVFHPSIYKKPEIFRQEGWRYEFGEDGDPVYSGVVFNEMKGAYSTPDSVLDYEMNKLLFPDNCYSFESGGHPENVPDLTYEHFLKMHKKFYHPSNARVSVCGSVDLDAVLEVTDSYLSEYDRQEADYDIPYQAPTGKKETTAYYEIGADEQPEEKTVVACGDMIGRFDEREKIVALAAISKYLADDNESPLKREILEKGLGQDLRFMICKWYQQPYITWQVWNTDPDKITEIRKTVREFLEKTVKEGFDKELFTAGFNRLAFEMRDRDSSGYPRSLEEAVGVLDSWLYGGDPADALEYDGIIDSLEAKIGTGYYEELLKEVLLENGHEAFVTLLPSNTLGKEKIEKEQARLDKESSVWTDSDIERLKKESETLKAWQQAPDSEEALATIPMLKLSDLADKPEAIETRTEKIGGRDLLITENGSKLAYMNLFFSASDTEFDDLKHVSLLCSLLGRLPTEDHDSATLQMLIKKNVGRFGTDIDVFACEKTDRAKVFVTVSAVSLENKVADTLELITEILTKTKYEDVRLVREILNQSALAAQMSLASRGHSFAITRALACNSAHSAAIEATSGFAFAEWLKAQSGASDGEILALLGRIAETAKRIFASARITLSVSSNVKRKDLETFVSSLPKGGNCAEYAFYKPLDVNKEGIVIPAAVGFAAKATNLNLHGRKYSGSLLALTNVLNYEYLWNEIRVQGGAYGCGFRAREDGDVFCYSYRDPKPGNSLSVYDRAKDFIKEFCKDEKDLTRYILGAVADIDPLLNEEQKLAVAEGRFFKGRTYADVCRVYTELLSTTSNDVLGLCDILEDLANDEVYCVAAGEALLDACGEQIEKRISL